MLHCIVRQLCRVAALCVASAILASAPALSQTVVADFRFRTDASGTPVTDGQAIPSPANLKDDSGSGFQGEKSGSPTYSLYALPAGASMAMEGAALNTAGGFVYFNDNGANPSLPRLTRNSNISMWLRVNLAAVTAGSQALIGVPNQYPNSYQWAMWVRPDGTLDMSFNASVGLASGLFNGTGPAITPGQWIDLGFSMDTGSGDGSDTTADTLKLYVNGTLFATKTFVSAFGDPASPQPSLHLGQLGTTFPASKASALYDRVIVWHGIPSDAAFFELSLPKILSVGLTPLSVVSGKTSKAKVTLSRAAPAGGYLVYLSSSNTAAATVPATMTIPAGAVSKAATVKTKGVATNTTATIKATRLLESAEKNLLVKPASLLSVTLSPAKVVGGKSSIGKVALNGFAPPGGGVVALTNANPAATVPASATVPYNKTSKTFTITTVPVVANTAGAIKATYRGVTKKATLTVTPPALQSLTLTPSTVTGGTNSTAKVTLTGKAPAGGIVVSVATSDAAVALPVDGAGSAISSVTVPEGALAATFTVKTFPVASTQTAAISAQRGAVIKAKVLTVNP